VIDVELFRAEGVVTVFPTGPLSQADFVELAGLVDPYIEQQGALKGVMIIAQQFPGWDDFAALLDHVRFVRNHEARVRRVALVTDSAVLELVPALARHFVQAEVRRFPFEQRDAAFDWLKAA
jgi:hypothetical protein